MLSGKGAIASDEHVDCLTDLNKHKYGIEYI